MLVTLLVVALGAGHSLGSPSSTVQYSNSQRCIVPSHGNVNISDTPAIQAAFKKCGKGGRIIFSENTTYALNELTVSPGYNFESTLF